MNMACWITSSRFILAPLVFWQLSAHSTSGMIWAIVILLVSGSSDVLDGWVARARNEVSELGKALDPLADKLVIFCTLLGLVWWGLPGWMVLVYLVKEAAQVLAGVLLFQKAKQLIPANWWGKSSTIGFFSGFGVFFINNQVGTIIIGIAVLISIYALFTYYRAFEKLKKTLNNH